MSSEVTLSPKPSISSSSNVSFRLPPAALPLPVDFLCFRCDLPDFGWSEDDDVIGTAGKYRLEYWLQFKNFQTNGLFEIHLNCFKSMEIPGVEIQAGLGVLANVGSAGRGRLVDAI